MIKTLPQGNTAFPPPPVAASALFQPITSWADMYRETTTTGVEFEQFWFERVQEGVAYFFSWLGDPRATALVVWDNAGPTHVECRKGGDTLVSPADIEPILAAVTQAFRDAGFGRTSATQ